MHSDCHQTIICRFFTILGLKFSRNKDNARTRLNGFSHLSVCVTSQRIDHIPPVYGT